jgi:uncharacterized protein
MISSHPLRVMAFIGGWISLILGCIGIFLPLLPTTPFILLAAYCFSRSSERLYQWLFSHPQMGLLIRDWEHSGCIRKSAKVKATILIFGMFMVTFIVVNVELLVKVMIAIIGISVLSFIWTRPVPPNDQIVAAKVAVE